MKIEVQTFINNIQSETYGVDMAITTKQAILSESQEEILSNFYDTFMNLLTKNPLVRMELLIEGFASTTRLVLESGIINLPFANTKAVDNFFPDLTKEVPLKLNFIVESKDLNPSGLHIDTVMDLASTKQNKQELIAFLSEKTTLALEKILATEVKQQEEALVS